MNTKNKSHFLSLSQPTIDTNGLEQLVSMWSVISKCKDHLEEGARLENMSWRLWHQKHRQPILSLSPGKSIHEVSQTKETQNNHVSDKNDWSFSFVTVPSQQQPTTTKAKFAGSINAFIPSTTTTTTNNSRTTTPSLSNSYQYENDDDDDDDDFFDQDDYDDDFYDNDDLYDENDNYIYDEEQEETFMHYHHNTEKLRPYFTKTSPRPLRQQESLLSALFKTSSPSSSLNPTNSNSHRSPPDHFLKKEWTESLRDNVLWEHVQQQKPLYTQSHPSSSYYHHPPPSTTYQSPYYHRHNNRPPSDPGCLESFHGW